jgi:glutamyl-tRNA reductase
MSVLVVGISHKTAPVALLERVALDSDGVNKLLGDVIACEHVTEATVIATCNRLEIYADVDRFHGSVEGVSRMLVDRAARSSAAPTSVGAALSMSVSARLRLPTRSACWNRTLSAGPTVDSA